MSHDENVLRTVLWATDFIRAARVRPDRLARRHAGSSLVQKLLEQIGARHAVVDYAANGKPIVPGASGLHVSIAHTADIIAAAASTVGPVGIDVEDCAVDRDFPRLAEAAFGPAEIAAVMRHGRHAFYRVWVTREAIGKATGEGLSW